MSSLDDINQSNPSDESVERSIGEQKRYSDKRKNSIVPEFLENTGIKPSEEMSNDLQVSETRNAENEEDFNDLSSDKEEDTTEGEITDTHTSE